MTIALDLFMSCHVLVYVCVYACDKWRRNYGVAYEFTRPLEHENQPTTNSKGRNEGMAKRETRKIEEKSNKMHFMTTTTKSGRVRHKRAQA